MNTPQLKKFSQEARRCLMKGVIQRLNFWGYDKNGILTEEPMFVPGGVLIREEAYDEPGAEPKWKALQKAIREHGYKNVVEEAAYTWFNRLMAIRILAKNDFDTPQLEYGGDGMNTPLILRRARSGSVDFLDSKEIENLRKVLTDYDKEYRAFSILISGYCKHHKLLSSVFGKINDYSDLLLPSNILEENGFIHLINTSGSISDEDYKSPELIGWLYQFYISEKKDEVFASFKKNKKAEAEDIPAATQIFTPNWIVKYMVQNTAGKIWLDEKPDSKLREKMKYLVETPQPSPSEQKDPDNQEKTLFEAPSPSRGGGAEGGGGQSLIQANPKNLKLLDPACGSGHILTEGFDLIYEMYMEDFYSPGEAVESILKNNLFGLDIDLRAAQLARFAVLLKAAAKDKSILDNGILPRVFSMPEKDPFDRSEVRQFLGAEGAKWENELFSALDIMQDAQNLGSIMVFDISDEMMAVIRKRKLANSGNDLLFQAIYYKITPFLEVLLMLSSKHEVVVTNPPYMVSGNFNSNLKNYCDKYYKYSKGDLFSVFMDVCFRLIEQKGTYAMINQTSWLFKSSFLDFRKSIYTKYHIDSLLHIGPGLFEDITGEVVQSAAFIIKQKDENNSIGYFYDLQDERGASKKEKQFFNKLNHPFKFNLKNIKNIPEWIFAYWMSDKGISIFNKAKELKRFCDVKKGIATGDDNRFLRFWPEVSFNTINFNSIAHACGLNTKWVPVNKGGGYRKWAGNSEFVLNWYKDGEEIKSFFSKDNKLKSRPQNLKYNYLEGITYNIISSKSFSGRYSKAGFMMTDVGPTIFCKQDLKIFLGLLNSKVGLYFFSALCSGYKFDTGKVGLFPILDKFSLNRIDIENKVDSCINISSKDWNIDETSWEFKSSPIIQECGTLQLDYNKWEFSIIEDFFLLHKNEEDLNQIFIDLYGLQEELTKEIALKDISILKEVLDRKKILKFEQAFRINGKAIIKLPIDKAKVISQFCSYAVGIYMGRYRLDRGGLNIAHPNPNEEELSAYKYNGSIVNIDDDGIIPLMTRDCAFPDNGVNRVKELIEIIWGEETLTENMNFLEECLGTSLETYMYRDFWKDHCKRYKKTPIYWMFASKNAAFQVLVYMHRMNRHTVEKIRSLDLLPHIKFLSNQIAQMEHTEGSLSAIEARRLDKFRKDYEDCTEYDLRLKDVADKQIEFDLDDGVKRNYGLFGSVVREIK